MKYVWNFIYFWTKDYYLRLGFLIFFLIMAFG